MTAYFSPIPRKIGFRNIRRRFGNTVLVVIGSLVGAALISGSLVLSDSLDKTFVDIVHRMIGEQDAEITLSEKAYSNKPLPYLAEEETEEIKDMLDIDEVDGVFTSLAIRTSPQKINDEGEPVINTYQIRIDGVDMESLKKFGESPVELVDIKDNEVLISKPLAKKLELSVGDTIRAPYGPLSIDFKVKKIYEENGLIDGWRIITTNKYLTSQLGIPKDSYNTIVISAKGGIEPENYDGPEFEKTLEKALEDFDSDTYELSVMEWKKEALEGYGMKTFVIMFIVLSFFGVFSGILLIVNLYSMLAEERKREMGILRAIALTRLQLTKTFIYEGFLYTLISSAIGSILGVGIGYILVHSLDQMFAKMMSLTGGEDLFKLSFGFKWQSLLIAFSAGFLFTIVTAILSSYKISKLSIVTAIKDIKEKADLQIGCKWIAKTFVYGLGLFSSLLFTLSFFVIRTFMDEGRNQDGNPLAEMTTSNYNDTVDLIQAHVLYIGIQLTLALGVMFINRIAKALLKKDIDRVTVTIASLSNIAITASMITLDSFRSAFMQDAGTALFFILSVSLVISLALAVTYNLNIISTILGYPLRRIGSLRSVVRMAFRYPAENIKRTGITLVMFALIIFLIAYVSMVKATVDQETRKMLLNTLGGYDLIIIPGPDTTMQQTDQIIEDLEDLKDVDRVSKMGQTVVVLPQYKYKDLEEAQYWGDPSQTPSHSEEDSFRSYYSSLPEDFIKKARISLSERAKGYETDEEVWDKVIEDSSKIVLGDAFAATQGFGQQPKISVGDKVIVSDLFEQKDIEKEVIGIVKAQEGGSPSASFSPYIITTNKHVEEEFDENYLNRYSAKSLLAAFNGDNTIEKTNSIKKELISYNISMIMNIDDMTETAISFINSMMILLQGFLAFCLIVGTSGLAIIITRAVHERRQQIGMMRSLGFQRWMILASFFIESTFITMLGIVIGLSTGTIGALISFEVAYQDQPDVSPVFPIREIALICLFVYIASMLFAILPSIKAARLSPVEATDYPE